MSAVWYWSRRYPRARARSYVGVAVLLALLGGLTLASLAGRRTAAFVAGALTPGGRPDLSFQAEAVGSLDGLYFTDRFAVTEGNAVAAVPARLAGTTPVATILRSE